MAGAAIDGAILLALVGPLFLAIWGVVDGFDGSANTLAEQP